jgi:hypothetical protein
MKTINTVLVLLVLTASSRADAQSMEAVGTRALGMGGAFVAVADDATATYWNPAGVATGATFSALFDVNTSDLVAGGDDSAALSADTRAQDLSGRALAMSTPPLGLSYYHIRTYTLGAPAVTQAGDPEDEEAGAPNATALDLHQFGVTLVQSLLQGLTVGTTMKVTRGSGAHVDVATGQTVDEALDRTGELEREGSTKFDLDAGVMFAAGPIRLGFVAKNLLAPEFPTTDLDPANPSDDTVRLERQYRLGVAVTPGHFAEAPGAATTIAVDVDLEPIEGVFGEARQVAVGGEQWLWSRRIGVRAGGRWNWLRKEERSASVGISVGIRSGTYIDGQLTRGRDEYERGWSIATRTSF